MDDGFELPAPMRQELSTTYTTIILCMILFGGGGYSALKAFSVMQIHDNHVLICNLAKVDGY